MLDGNDFAAIRRERGQQSLAVQQHRLAGREHSGIGGNLLRVVIDVDGREEQAAAAPPRLGYKVRGRALLDDHDEVGICDVIEAVEHHHVEIPTQLGGYGLSDPVPGYSACPRADGESFHRLSRSASSFDLISRRNSPRERSP